MVNPVIMVRFDYKQTPSMIHTNQNQNQNLWKNKEENIWYWTGMFDQNIQNRWWDEMEVGLPTPGSSILDPCCLWSWFYYPSEFNNKIIKHHHLYREYKVWNMVEGVPSFT